MRDILAAAPPLPSLGITDMRQHALTSKRAWNEAAKRTVSIARRKTDDALVMSSGGADGGAIVHLHGGGWSIGSPETHLSLLAGLSQGTGRPVVAPRPRQAPEHPFPLPVEDVLQGLAHQGDTPFVLCGDSAGANLALAAMLRARDAGEQLPILGVVLFYGCYRRRFDTESHRAYGEGHGLTTEKMRRFWDLYAPNGGAYADLTDADFTGLPPVQLHLARCDPLADDSAWLHDRLRASGVDAEILVWPGMAHGFLHYTPDLPQAKAAFACVGRFVETLSAAGPVPDTRARVSGPAGRFGQEV